MGTSKLSESKFLNRGDKKKEKDFVSDVRNAA
jgi:hypothetical protein